MSASNLVQTLHKKRGRPKSKTLPVVAALWDGEITCRSSLYNRIRAAEPAIAARKLGLIDSNNRDARTGKRMQTKFAELGRIFHWSFWETSDGEQWLLRNWPAIVDATAHDLIRWARQNNPKSLASAAGAQVDTGN